LKTNNIEITHRTGGRGHAAGRAQRKTAHWHGAGLYERKAVLLLGQRPGAGASAAQLPGAANYRIIRRMCTRSRRVRFARTSTRWRASGWANRVWPSSKGADSSFDPIWGVATAETSAPDYFAALESLRDKLKAEPELVVIFDDRSRVITSASWWTLQSRSGFR